MPESKLHKQVSKYPDAGSTLGQSVGGAIDVVATTGPNKAIRHGPASGRRPDRLVMTKEGVAVAVEHRVGNGLSQEKLNQYIKAKMPVMEIDWRTIGYEPSDGEIQQWLAVGGKGALDRFKPFLYVPHPADIVRRQGGETAPNDPRTPIGFGNLGCYFPNCCEKATNYVGSAYMDSHRVSEFEGVAYETLVQSNAIRNLALPRFSCREHMVGLSTMTLRGGHEWYKYPAERGILRRSYHSGITPLGSDTYVSFTVETDIDGPPALALD